MSSCTRGFDKFLTDCSEREDAATLVCIEEGEVERDRCAREEDRGHQACAQQHLQTVQSCAAWDSGCSDWGWFSFICEAITWFCVAWATFTNWICDAWQWVSNVVCVAWATVTEWGCVAWHWAVEAGCTLLAGAGKFFICKPVDFFRCAFTGGVVSIGKRAPGGPPPINHVFVLMLENRSFDHMLGFSGIQGTDAETGAATQIDGLGGPDQPIVDDDGIELGRTGINADAADNDFTAATPAEFFLSGVDMDPRHEFADVLEQVTGVEKAHDFRFAPGEPYPTPGMQGFVRNYLKTADGDRGASPANVMNGYTQQQLPILNALAREFAVCDRWFSSMPGPTVPNRLFVHAASSGGLDDSPGEVTDTSSGESVEAMILDGFRFDGGTIFDRLDDACRDWTVFEGDETPWAFGLSGMNFETARFVDFEDFEDEVSDLDPFVSYIFIEPSYGRFWDDFVCGTSQHPLDDVVRGERLIKEAYETIRNSNVWDTSMLIITYDEHGGFYDHVQPPQATEPGDGVTDPEHNQHDFSFKQLGVRVPAVVVSPWIPKGTIDHRTYDHSSIPKTVFDLFGLRTMTNRDRDAKSLLPLLSLAEARTDAPTSLPEPADSGFFCLEGIFGLPIPMSITFPNMTSSAAMHSAEDGGSGKDKKRKRFSPTLRAFLYNAARRLCSVARPGERPRIRRMARGIRTGEEALEFMVQARNYLKSHKMLNRRPLSRRGHPER